MSEVDFMLDGTAFGLAGLMLAFCGYLMYWCLGMWYYHEFLPRLRKRYPSLWEDDHLARCVHCAKPISSDEEVCWLIVYLDWRTNLHYLAAVHHGDSV